MAARIYTGEELDHLIDLGVIERWMLNETELAKLEAYEAAYSAHIDALIEQQLATYPEVP